MANWLGVYAVSFVIMLALDALWLGAMLERVYRPQLGALMRDKIDLLPAALFYVIYAGAIAALVVWPALARRDAVSAILPGLLLGLAAYGTYNLTNASVLKGWPSLLTWIDLSWGTVVTGVTAFAATALLLRFTNA